MPGMDVASASVAFIQFSVSTAQAIKQLHDFIQAIRDAPKTVKKLVDEVALLGRIIEEVRNGGDNVGVIEASTLDGFNAAEQLVRGIVERLHEKLVRNLPHVRDSSQRRFLKSLKSVLSKDDVTEDFAVLERAKTLLLLAQGALHFKCSQEARGQLQSLSEGQKLISSASALGPVTIQYISQSVSINNSVRYETSTKGTHNWQETEAGAPPAGKAFGTDLNKLVSNQNLSPKQAKLFEFYLSKALDYVAEQDQQVDMESIVPVPVDTLIPRYTKIVSQEELGAGLQPLDQSRKRLSDYSFGSSHPVHVTTVYDHPWIGKIIVRRKTKQAKQWNPQHGIMERLREEQTTTLELKPAPWLAMPFASIEVQMQRSQFMNEPPKINFNPPHTFPYFRMPEELCDALEAGNLEALQQALSDNVIPLGGRDHKGRNLLDMSLESFGNDYINFLYDAPEQMPALLKMAEWFYTQGVRTEMNDSHHILTNHLYLSVYQTSGDIADNTYKMEQLLINVTADAPAIPRAKTLLHFAILNTDHSIYLESVISDIIDDAVTVDEHRCAKDLAKLESELVALRAQWAPISAKYDDYPIGVEHMLLMSWIQMRRLSKFAGDGIINSAERFRHLKGPRYILLVSFLMYSEPYYSRTAISEPIANMLRFCRRCSPTILEDGFGDFVSKVACRSNLLGLWYEILNLAGFPAAEFISRHTASHEHIQKPLRVQLAQIADSSLPHSWSALLTVKDPHDLGEMQSWEQWTKQEEQFVFNSHDTLRPPELCIVHQEGSELFFDCGITDPAFENGLDWALEQDYFDDIEEKMEYYTEEDAFTDFADPDEQIPDQTKGRSLLSHLVSGGASVLSSIV